MATDYQSIQKNGTLGNERSDLPMPTSTRPLQLMTTEQFRDLCQTLTAALHFRQEEGRLVWECDHTFRYTRAWLEAHGLNVADHLEVLALVSVFCDCEILGIEAWPPFDEALLRRLVESSPA
jgi:hypothetical protein